MASTSRAAMSADPDSEAMEDLDTSSPFALLTHRTFPTRHRLWKSSCCPTMDLAALTSRSSPNASGGAGKGKGASSSGAAGREAGHAEEDDDLSDDTVNLYRLGGSAPKVWSWTASSLSPSEAPPSLGAGPSRSDTVFGTALRIIDVRGDRVHVPMERKEKAAQGEKAAAGSEWERKGYGIASLEWSPDGQYLAVTLSSKHSILPPRPSMRTPRHAAWPSLLILLSVHTGQPIVSPLLLPGISSDSATWSTPTASTSSSSSSPHSAVVNDYSKETSKAPEKIVFSRWLELDSRLSRANSSPDADDDDFVLPSGAGGEDEATAAERAQAFAKRVRGRKGRTRAEELIESLPRLNPPLTLTDLAASSTTGVAGGAASSAFSAGLAPSSTQSDSSILFPSPSWNVRSVLSYARLPPSLPPAPSPHLPPPKDTLLVVATDAGRVHVFLGGTVFVGSMRIGNADGEGEVRILGADAVSLEDQTPDVDPEDVEEKGTRLWLVWGTTSSAGSEAVTIRHGYLDLSHHSFDPSAGLNTTSNPTRVLLPLPSSDFSENLRLSSLTFHLLTGAIRSFRTASGGWRDARDQGHKFVDKIGDASRAQGCEMEAGHQLNMLLMSGRPTEPLKDFLGTKNTERALAKWESSMNAAVLKLRESIYQVVVPTLERLMIIVNDRKLHWFGDPLTRPIPTAATAKELESLKEGIHALIVKLYGFEGELRKEHVLFNQFARWLRYEIETLAYQDAQQSQPQQNAEPKPWVRHDLLAVDEYLSERLGPRMFDHDLSWYGPSLPSDLLPEEVDSYVAPSKDQKRAFVHDTLDWLLGEPGVKQPDFGRDPPALRMPWLKERPANTLLGIAKAFGDMFRPVFNRLVSDDRPLREVEVLSQAPSVWSVRTFSVADCKELEATREGHVEVDDHNGGSPQPGRLLQHLGVKATEVVGALSTLRPLGSDGAARSHPSVRWDAGSTDLKILDADFFDDTELVQLVQVGTGVDARYRFATFATSTLIASHDHPPPVKRSHTLDTYAPSSIALNGRPGRRIGCVLSGEGRSFDVFDLDEGDIEIPLAGDEEGEGAETGDLEMQHATS